MLCVSLSGSSSIPCHCCHFYKGSPVQVTDLGTGQAHISNEPARDPGRQSQHQGGGKNKEKTPKQTPEKNPVRCW